jgi:hypothetical protein
MRDNRKWGLLPWLAVGIWLLVGASSTIAQPYPPDREKHALIISGIGGEETYQQQFKEWTTRLHRLLIGQLGFAPDRVVVLTETPGYISATSGETQEGRSTAAEVRRALSKWEREVTPRQQVFLFFIGHGTYDGKVAKFNLVGPDLAAEEYAEMLSRVRAGRTIILQMASASGEFLKPLAALNRIVLTATRSGMEQNAPKFMEFFLQALESKTGDLDKNGRVSVLEAFEYAAQGVAGLYQQAGKLATEHALLDDTGDGVGDPANLGSSSTGGREPSAEVERARDGGLARATYFDSLPQQEAGGDVILAGWIEERMRLEGAIEQLKVQKPTTPPREYAEKLEKMLIELARLSRTIRQRRGEGPPPSPTPSSEEER